ncbi:uncharacterized protein M6B38_277960 [Iris pallida]|uniref:FLZ-type domain-containing protein n=1 Tax=Iris pallida TaxID=29817 RepID=A0AAX6I3C3_IRIPA|nr:uncharacterized protein M6B38_277960 [Iris pallida]
MLMGKRPRPHMRRTTSMTGFELDVVDPMEVADAPQPSDPQGEWLAVGRVAGAVASRSRGSSSRRNSGDFVAIDIAPFLKNCGLCSRRLRPGKDIYMYRGEIAFCSLECREQQIMNDERIEKRALTVTKSETPSSATGSEASGSSSSSKPVPMA